MGDRIGQHSIRINDQWRICFRWSDGGADDVESEMLKFDPPIHPGEILREEFLAPLKLSSGALAKALGVPRTRIERIVKEQMGISADTALRLAKYFDTTPNVWLNLQASYDLAIEAEALREPLAAIHTRDAGNDNRPHLKPRARA